MAEIASLPGASQIMAARDITEGHQAVPAGHGRQLPPWLLVAALLGGLGGGGTGIATAIGSIGGGDVDDLARDVELHREAQDKRIDAHEAKLESIGREQQGHQRWVATEIAKQARALARVAERVGAEVDVAVEPYQSGGM